MTGVNLFPFLETAEATAISYEPEQRNRTPFIAKGDIKHIDGDFSLNPFGAVDDDFKNLCVFD